jgi:hypothetical protein
MLRPRPRRSSQAIAWANPSSHYSSPILPSSATAGEILPGKACAVLAAAILLYSHARGSGGWRWCSSVATGSPRAAETSSRDSSCQCWQRGPGIARSLGQRGDDDLATWARSMPRGQSRLGRPTSNCSRARRSFRG